jgi:hypothetical protein
LEVLVGKVLEAARFELIRDDEQIVLHKEKGRFKQMKESMLMQTQRLEGERVRRNQEQERRNIQIKTHSAL